MPVNTLLLRQWYSVLQKGGLDDPTNSVPVVWKLTKDTAWPHLVRSSLEHFLIDRSESCEPCARCRYPLL